MNKSEWLVKYPSPKRFAIVVNDLLHARLLNDVFIVLGHEASAAPAANTSLGALATAGLMS